MKISDATAKKIPFTLIPLGLGIVILGVMALVSSRDTKALLTRHEDMPPVIDFTWTPAGAVSLRDMRGYLTIHDDYAIDFTTYRMRLVEADKTIDLPIDGLIGKDYEQPISFSLIADDPRLVNSDRLTVEITVADDRGHESNLTRVIALKH